MGRKFDETAEGARGGGIDEEASASPYLDSNQGEEVQIIFEKRPVDTRQTECRDSGMQAPRASRPSDADLTHGQPISPTEAGDGVVGGAAGVYESIGDARAGQCGRSSKRLEREGHGLEEESRGDESKEVWAEEDDCQRDGGLDKIDMMIMHEMRAQADALERVRANGRRHVTAGVCISTCVLCVARFCARACT